MDFTDFQVVVADHHRILSVIHHQTDNDHQQPALCQQRFTDRRKRHRNRPAENTHRAPYCGRWLTHSQTDFTQASASTKATDSQMVIVLKTSEYQSNDTSTSTANRIFGFFSVTSPRQQTVWCVPPEPSNFRSAKSLNHNRRLALNTPMVKMIRE